MTKTFIPAVYGPTAPPEPPKIGTMTVLAYDLSVLWMEKLGNRKHRMQVDERLVKAAQKHAEYLVGRTEEQMNDHPHRGRHGSWANQRVEREGYHLPKHYPMEANHVESAVSGDQGKGEFESLATFALRTLLDSPHHFQHIMGMGFFEPHTRYGVGQAGSQFVIVTAPPEG
jgi:hypothetical protein